MCGIAGLLSGTDLPLDRRPSPRAAAALLRHRGPDQNGIHHGARFMLVNTRLKVQDVSKNANLPFVLPQYGLALAYNGEVSNFQELAKKYNLQSKYGLHSKSDTEVIALLYLEKGIDFLSELSGMFSIAIIDEQKNKGFLVRDFYGITPLFYRFTNSTLQFASELKVLKYWDKGGLSVNRQAIFDLLTLGYIPQTQTPYLEIHELDKGHFIEFDFNTGASNLKKYYQLNYLENKLISRNEAAENIRELAFDSIRRNLVSEAPLGMTLSGGVDTSTILGIVHQLGLSHGMHTFSIKVEESSFDESIYQQLMAKKTGTIHHEIPFSHKDVIEHIVKHVAYLDEPSANGATIPSFILSKIASQHVKVLLSGEGGDEIFSAYDTHLASLVRQTYLKLPKLFRNQIRKIAKTLPTNHSKLSFDFKIKRFVDGAELSPAAAHIFWRHGFRESNIRKLVIDGEKMRSTYDLFEEIYEKNKISNQLNGVSFLDLDQYLYGDLMVKNDRMIMAHSIESRFPFLDRPLVEYMTTVPTSLRIKRLQPRYIQKYAMRNILPKEILRRKSFGLEIPHSKWLLGPLEFLVDEYLSKKSILAAELFDYEVVKKMWAEHKSHRIDHGRGLWSILICQIWHRIFLQSNDYLNHLELPDNFENF